MSIEKVREYFELKNIPNKILEFSVSSATVELAAQAVGTEPCRIAKTMSFFIGEEAVVVVLAGDVKVDNKKFKEVFHTKAKMIPYDAVERYTGHAPGGVCPFALKSGVKVYLDISLCRFKTVFPAAGSSNSAVEMTISDLQKYSKAEGFVDISKPQAENL